MTVPTQLFRWLYTATAAASTLYPYTNKILDEDDLKVYVEDTLQMISTHYTVTGVGLAVGGNVSFVTAPAEDEEILITKDGVQFTQKLDYVENDAFPAEKHEDGLDKLTNIAQKIWDYVRRSVKLPITSEYTDMTLPDPEANMYLGWNAAGDALENLALVSLGAISDTAYNSTIWDGATGVAPTKNAVRDKIESMISDDINDVTAAANIDANFIVVGDDGAKGVKKFALGTANQIVGINAGGTALEMKNRDYVKASDTKASETHGGTFSQDGWRTRDINTEDSDASAICSIGSNRITLEAGTYICSISAPAFRCGTHFTQLYNISDSAVTLFGTVEWTLADANYPQTRSFIVGKFTIAAQKIFEVQHYCTVTRNDDGFGIYTGVNGIDSIYTIAEFWRI